MSEGRRTPDIKELLALGTFFVGADANALWFPGLEGANGAFTLHGQLGVKF